MGLKRESSILTEKEMLMDIKPITTRCIIIKDVPKDRVELLVLKKISKDGHVTYTFPGGHLEEGENPTDGLVREIWEETGVNMGAQVIVERYRHYKIDKKQPERGNGVMAWFVITTYETPDPKESYFEHDKWVIPTWITLEDFLKVKPKDIKPDFIKPYVLEQIEKHTHESKWIEEVYTC